MDRHTVKWVYQELPELVSQGVVPPEVAQRIRDHYGDTLAAGSKAKRWAILLFSIIGAALIGGGIILLLAHNWEDLSRPMRAVISVLPLALLSAVGGWLLWTQRPGTTWREGIGTAQTLAIGSSIALVAQTYNLGGRFDEFMLTWSLLALPLAYLLGASLPILLYLIGITVWVGSVAHHGLLPLWYFPLFGLALPYLWWAGRANRYHPRPILIAWVLAPMLCIGSGMALTHVFDELHLWPVLFAGVSSLLFLCGVRWWGEASSIWQRPLQNVGALFAIGLSLLLSFADSWKRFSIAGASVSPLEIVAVAAFPAAALVLWIQSWKNRTWPEIMAGSFTILAVIAWICATRDAASVSMAVFNLFLFALGIGALVTGLRAHRMGVVNSGMLVLAAVILCRFFDSDLGFVLRGIAFILIGIGFLITNAVLLRWKGAVK